MLQDALIDPKPNEDKIFEIGEVVDLHGTQIIRVGDEEILFAFSQQLIQDTRVKECIVQITVTGRVPVLLVIISAFRARKESLFHDTRITGLVESSDTELLICILFDDAKSIIVCVEGGHEDERDIYATCSVEVLDLTDSQVKKSHVVFNFESTLGTGHSWTKEAKIRK